MDDDNGRFHVTGNFTYAEEGSPIVQVTLTHDGLAPVVARSSTATSGLVSWWKADGNALDSTGTNPGTLVNGASFVPGVVGQAFSLPGSNDYISLGNSPSLNPNYISVGGWWYGTDFTGNGNNPLVDKGYTSHSAPFYQYHLGITGNQYSSIPGEYNFSVSVGGVAYAIYSGPTNVYATGQWNHFVGTYDGMTLSLYRDGALIASNSIFSTPHPIDAYPTDARIGGFSNLSNASLPGLLDEIQIYNTALTASQIESIYNGRSSVADAALTATATPVTTAVYGTPFSGDVATFVDANPAATLADFPMANVTIQWGDGQTSNATGITQPDGPGTAFHVVGGHTYGAAGATATPLGVTITDIGGSVSNTTSYAENVAKANATIAVTAYTSANTTYNATAHTATGTVTGVAGDLAAAGSSLTLLGTTHTDAGTYNGDAWSFSGGANYNDATGTVDDSIAQATATVVVNGYTGVYDATAHGATGTATGIGGVDLSAGLNLGATFSNFPGGTANRRETPCSLVLSMLVFFYLCNGGGILSFCRRRSFS